MIVVRESKAFQECWIDVALVLLTLKSFPHRLKLLLSSTAEKFRSFQLIMTSARFIRKRKKFKRPWLAVMVVVMVTICTVLMTFSVLSHKNGMSSTDKASDAIQLPFALLPNLLPSHQVRLVVLVSSDPVNYAYRQTIRQTWARDSLQRHNVLVLFLMASPTSGELKLRVVDESRLFQDLLLLTQSDKVEMEAVKIGLEFVSDHLQFQFAMKVKDNDYVNITNLLKFLHSPSTKSSNENSLAENRDQLISRGFLMSKEMLIAVLRCLRASQTNRSLSCLEANVIVSQSKFTQFSHFCKAKMVLVISGVTVDQMQLLWDNKSDSC